MSTNYSMYHGHGCALPSKQPHHQHLPVGLRTVPYTNGCMVPYYGHGTRTIGDLCALLTVQFMPFDAVVIQLYTAMYGMPYDFNISLSSV
jgi:hypothetical protein